jgi:glutathione synthase/RimK-type ligase-like ATP-grasp enzyme
MTTVGMLHHRLDPGKVFKAYAYAAAAKAEGVDFFYFTPGRVHLEEKTIRAQVLEEGEWIEKVVPFPDVIYNAASPITAKSYEIYEKLEESIPFTSHSIGDKLTVYQSIQKSKEFSRYLLPTEQIKNAKMVLDRLTHYPKIVLKPVSGHKGLGLRFMEQGQTEFMVREGSAKTQSSYNTEDIIKYLDILIKDEPYLVQPFISCQTKAGLAFDFRLHVQKNGEGKWEITAIFPRIAAPGRLVTNLASGGYTTTLAYFLAEEFEDNDYNMKRYLECFALSFAENLDKIYDHSLDELGIDVGLDADRKIWIYEVNWRPGTPASFCLQLDVAIHTIRYAVYLANRRGKGE